jgi:hypothetical protein
MKIAVILTGHCRDFHKTFDTFKNNVFDKNDVDVYFNTWDVNQNSVNREVNGHFNLPNYYVDKSSVLNKLQPYLKNYNFESWENYEKNRFPNISLLEREDDVFKVNQRAIYHGSYYIERIRDQWWMVKQAWDLIENPYQYDIIMRVRFDMLFHNIELKKAKFVVPKSDIEFYKIETNWSDYFAYGEPDAMYKYFHMFNSIEDMYVDYNIDITHAEQMHEWYMKEYGNKVQSFIDSEIIYEKVKKH